MRTFIVGALLAGVILGTGAAAAAQQAVTVEIREFAFWPRWKLSIPPEFNDLLNAVNSVDRQDPQDAEVIISTVQSNASSW